KFLGDSQGTGRANLTRTGELYGTPLYVAPERHAGEADDGRSDVFSLGAMLYTMICGAPPWTREEQLHALVGFANDLRPRTLHRIRDRVPPELDVRVGRALAWTYGQRPAAREFAAALRELAPRLDDTPAELVQTTAGVVVGFGEITTGLVTPPVQEALMASNEPETQQTGLTNHHRPSGNPTKIEELTANPR